MSRVRSVVVCVSIAIVGGFVALDPDTASAQEPPMDHQHMMPADTEGWRWSGDANLFVGVNEQERRFADFRSWESQNWMMGAGERPLGRGHLELMGMLTLEPFTMPAAGSPQLFQTGESYRRTPLVNLQHPHDLVMGVGVSYRRPVGKATLVGGADLVGSATLGPTPFMHRASARDNPQVPLGHHVMDSTHISAGVLRAGITFGSITVEGSTFRGAEPDENRRNIERPRLDSYAGRVRVDSGPWHAQVSAGHLTQPEWYEPYDQNRITASLGYEGTVRTRPLSITAVWGGTREFNGFNGNADGYLLEWDLRAAPRSTVYGRAEVDDKELFGLGLHEKGFSHRHVLYTVGALTAGYLFDVADNRWGRVGLGADMTRYHMPTDLVQYYGGSSSYHVFVRWRPRVAIRHMH